MNKKRKIDKTMEFKAFRVVFKKTNQIYEFGLTYEKGIQYAYLNSLYSRMSDWYRQRGYQLLIVMPVERIVNTSVPTFVTQDFDRCSVFDFQKWFDRFNMQVVYKNGRVRKVIG